MNLFQDDIDFILDLKERAFYDSTSNVHSSRTLERVVRAGLVGHVKVNESLKTNLYMLTRAGDHTAGLLLFLTKQTGA